MKIIEMGQWRLDGVCENKIVLILIKEHISQWISVAHWCVLKSWKELFGTEKSDKLVFGNMNKSKINTMFFQLF